MLCNRDSVSSCVSSDCVDKDVQRSTFTQPAAGMETPLIGL